MSLRLQTDTLTVKNVTARAYQDWKRICGDYSPYTRELRELRKILSMLNAEYITPSRNRFDHRMSMMQLIMVYCLPRVRVLAAYIAGLKPADLSRSRSINWARIQKRQYLNDVGPSLALAIHAFANYNFAHRLVASDTRELRSDWIREIDCLVAEFEGNVLSTSDVLRHVQQGLAQEGISFIGLELARDEFRKYLKLVSDVARLDPANLSVPSSYLEFWSCSGSAVVETDYEKADDDELSLKRGEQLSEVEFHDHEYWWRGKNLRGEVGLFPSSHTWRIEEAAAPPEARTPEHNITVDREREEPSLSPQPTLNKLPEVQYSPMGTSQEGSHQGKQQPKKTRREEYHREWWEIIEDQYRCSRDQSQRLITYEALPSSEFYPVKSTPYLPQGWDWWVDPQNRIFYIDLCPTHGQRRCFWKPPMPEFDPHERPPPGWARIENSFGRIRWLHPQSGIYLYDYLTYNRFARFQESLLETEEVREQSLLDIDDDVACHISQEVWNYGLSIEARLKLGMWKFGGDGDKLARSRNEWLTHTPSPLVTRNLWHTLPFCSWEPHNNDLPSTSPGYCWRSEHLATQCLGKHVDAETLKVYRLPWHYVDDKNYIIIREWTSERSQNLLLEHTRQPRAN